MKGLRVNLLIFFFILALAVLATVFVLPKKFVNKYLPIFPDSAILGETLPWKLGLDLVGGTALVYEIDMTGANSVDYDDIASSLVKVIERRVNPLGTLEPKVSVTRNGSRYELLIELPGLKESEAIEQIGQTPILDFRELKVDGDKVLAVPTELTGRYITNARISYADRSLTPIVEFELNDEGAKLFEQITERNVGKQICIYVDGKPIFSDPKTGAEVGGSCPVVNSKISGGKAQISGGNITIAAAKEIVGRFKDGALAAPLKLINQRTVSATIAADSLNQIAFAGLIGTLAVMLFMILNYGFYGLISSIALIIYTALSLSIFKLFGVTMTLAGIAGFILSIGMAVDANILIFERTKEERKKGLGKVAAIEEGFKRAWLSIRDSNTSTAITSIILFYFTSSFIKGFALALLIGVLVSMFSAIYVTRVLLRILIRK